MNHVSVSPTDGNGPTQGQRKTLTRVGIELDFLSHMNHVSVSPTDGNGPPYEHKDPHKDREKL